MPYIKDTDGRRKELRDGAFAKSAGELNYQIFSYFKYSDLKNVEGRIFDHVFGFLHNNNKSGYPNYQKYNDMAGVMVLCTKELKRRLGLETKSLLNILDRFDKEINIYEDQKITENGDV